MNQAVIEAAARWAAHATAHPDALHAEVLTLRRPTGIQEADAHRALLADLLGAVHQWIQEPPR